MLSTSPAIVGDGDRLPPDRHPRQGPESTTGPPARADGPARVETNVGLRDLIRPAHDVELGPMSTVILYGTETGTGELVSDSIADVLAAEHDPSIYDMTDFAVDDLDANDFVIVVCSTYGEGELPTGAPAFADDLDAIKPDLAGLRFAVFGLGDKVYGDTFNRGGEIMAEMLTRLGATQVGEHGRHDLSSDIADHAGGGVGADDRAAHQRLI